MTPLYSATEFRRRAEAHLQGNPGGFLEYGDYRINAGAELKSALTACGGRGGGNAAIAQGTVPSLGALAAVAAALGRTA